MRCMAIDPSRRFASARDALAALPSRPKTSASPRLKIPTSIPAPIPPRTPIPAEIPTESPTEILNEIAAQIPTKARRVVAVPARIGIRTRMRRLLGVVIVLFLVAGLVWHVLGYRNPLDIADDALRLKDKVAGALDPNTTTNSIGMKFVRIKAGEFVMGTRVNEPNSQSDEWPQHRVRITKPFMMGRYEVTQGQYQAVMGVNPSRFSRRADSDDRPVENVSGDDAMEFCRRPSEKEGKSYRLPTEAEWEYACRAGVATAYCFGDDPSELNRYGWFDANSANVTHPVGEKRANAWGLYDMYGNVGEWCGDCYDEDYYARSPAADPTGPAIQPGYLPYRVLRGGSWDSNPQNCRSGCRSGYRSRSAPDVRDGLIGFRLCLDFP